jgi:hypothetical protein
MLHQERARVLRALALADQIPIDQTELQGHWGRYTCLISAGYFEVALRLILKKRIEQKSAPEIQNFVISNLESIQNPKAERFSKVLRSFSGAWGDALENFFLQNTEVKEAIDSLMANRHLIAHGKQCSISTGRVSEFFKHADKVIVFIDDLVNPQSLALTVDHDPIDSSNK